MESEVPIVTFRLPKELNKQLAARAERSGITKHALARSFVVRELDSTYIREMITNLAAIEDEITALRRSVARGIEAILQNVTELDEQAIREWVNQKLLGRIDSSAEVVEPSDLPTGKGNES